MLEAVGEERQEVTEFEDSGLNSEDENDDVFESDIKAKDTSYWN